MKKINIGLLGFGTVGQGVWKTIEMNRDELLKNTGLQICISKILINTPEKERDIFPGAGVLTTDPEDIFEDDSIQIVVELVGGTDKAKYYLEKAIEKGKHVVTANKALLALYGKELTEKAETKRCSAAL